MSTDLRQIFSGGFENKINLWNTKGKLKATSTGNFHQDCVSKIRYSPSAKNKYYASVGWDGRLKIWTQIFTIKISFKAHDAPIYSLAINTNGLYLATGCKGGFVKIWKLQNFKEPESVYQTDSQVNDLAFNPDYQWIAAATNKSIRIMDISQSEEESAIVLIKPEEGEKYKFNSLVWSSNGKFLYCGCSDGHIRVYKISVKNEGK